MKSLTTTQFEETLQQPYVVVKYGAEWCNACVAVQPVLERVAETSAIPFYTVDIDEEPALKTSARIKAIPMTVFYKNGRPVQFVYGEATEAAIQKKLNMLTR